VAGAAPNALIGRFELTPGSCAGGTVSGTYLRMILPSGTPSGPYMSNSDSRCSDQSYTPLSPGTDGGLVSSSYQPTPNPPFDKNGNALAGRITAPALFYGTSFATSSNAKDPQTDLSVSAPRVFANGRTLSADLRAFSVTWNNQYFNQGSPKPDGSLPGNTRAPSGTYDVATGAFTLNWTSQVVGGPFDKFTGQWHLAGRFVPAGSSGLALAIGGGGASAPTAGAARQVAPASVPHSGRIAASMHAPGATRGTGSAGATNAAADPAQRLAASTTTITRDKWHVSWWVIVLTAVIAVLGFGMIVALNGAIRPPRSAA